MATRERPSDTAVRDASEFLAVARREIRTARLELGMSQAVAARRAGFSRQQWGRLELGQLEGPTLEQLCRATRAVGLEPRFSVFKGETRVRDRGSLAALDRFARILAPPLGLRREVPIPLHGDKRAWDGRISDGTSSASLECESHLRDVQALVRRIMLKQRDDPRSGPIILVLTRSRHTREVLREHREALRALFPLDGAEIARLLRAGRVPAAGGVILV